MIMITPKIQQFYDCANCGEEIEITKDVNISQNMSPCCSYKCFFNVIYKFLKLQGIEYNLTLFEVFYPNLSIVCDVFYPESQEKQLLFDNSKNVVKKLLYSEKGGLSLYHQFIISS